MRQTRYINKIDEEDVEIRLNIDRQETETDKIHRQGRHLGQIDCYGR